MTIDSALVTTAASFAQQAGDLTLEYFKSDRLGTEHKADGTPVTVADTRAERLLRTLIAEAFPDDAIRGEEEDDVPGTSGRCWFIDPIDGTSAFTKGVPTYSNLLSLVDDDGPLVGIINLPALGETVSAGRGVGCFWNGEPTGVSAETDFGRQTFFTATGYEDFTPGQLTAVLTSGCSLRTWGDAYGYALVATGRCDIMFDPIVNDWDVAPMPVILAEAGGRFSSLDGRPGFDHGTGVATNGVLHDRVLELLAI